ncbi:hypothetical protein K439DRAFT_204824 [Ramaria rubella]|nr:hypothetical protein K439DRAFT_204824 [Ramaria rubella]
MYTLCRNPPALSALPEDILLEIACYLDVEDIFTLRTTNKRLYAFTASRHLWHQITFRLCYRLPLAIPPFRARSTISSHEFQCIIKRALRLENNWRSDSPQPTKPPRYIELTSSKDNYVMMLRLLPGGRLFLLITADGSLTCRDITDGRVVGEWKHGGYKVHSIDVDLVDDGQAMILTVSVDRLKTTSFSGGSYETHMVHVLRIDVTEDVNTGLQVNFVHIMASPWDSPWWIVSVEGDVIAAYACELTTTPLSQFVVWIANWRTATAAVVHLPESIINLQTWPTLQVVGGQVIIHEERGCSPASIIFPVPDTLFSTEGADPLPHVKITPTLLQDGDDEDNAYQTRFSKLWRNDRARNSTNRPLSLFAISMSTNLEAKRTVTVQTFDPFPTPKSLASGAACKTIQKSSVWKHVAFVPETHDGLRFTFCLGRYGSFPIWIEEDEAPAEFPEGTVYLPELRLMGLFTEYKDGATRHAKELACPEGMQLDDLQCLDFDDAEGILCGVTESGVWIIEYS